MDVRHSLFTLPQVILKLVALFLVGARVPTRERCSEEEGDGVEQLRWRLGLPMKPATN